MTQNIKYRKFLGPSQFAIAILGSDGYMTADQLKKEIEQGYQPWQNSATTFGNQNESVALYYYQKLQKVTIKKPKFVVDPQNRHIGGICDGLIDDDTGIEIKCHINEKNLLHTLPLKFLIQMAGYLFLYRKNKWILMSCTFNPDQTLSKYNLFEVTWDQVKDQWENDWYPRLITFVNSAKWHDSK